ncbi:cell division protein FtsX [Erythrobacter sp. NE805]|uniref:cell division protein FtsX n=1 Tax=Erythrobacter sp. NE805 TaxID=3389875 RepID=UPI00396B46FA
MSTLPPLPAEPDSDEAARAPERPRGRAAARLLPPTRLTGPIPWVIAILIALVVIAAAGGLALGNLAASANAGLSRAISVQVIEPNPDLRPARGAAAARLLTGLEGVQAVRLVPEAELTAMLEPWLGEGAASGDVPIPALIDVELTRPATPGEVARIEQALAAEVPGARVDAQGTWLGPVEDALAALEYLAFGLIALVALATAAAVWLAVRNAFAAARDTVEIMHLLGASQRQIAAVFLRDVVREAAFGAVLGGLAGAGAVWLLGRQFAALDSGMVSGGGLLLGDWLAIACIPLAGVLLALATARITIALALKDML